MRTGCWTTSPGSLERAGHVADRRARGAAPRHLHGRTERRHPAPLRAIRAGLRRRARVPAALHDPALRAARCRLRQDRGRAAGRRGHPRHHRRGPGAADAGAAGRQHHLWRPDPSGGRQRRHADDHGARARELSRRPEIGVEVLAFGQSRTETGYMPQAPSRPPGARWTGPGSSPPTCTRSRRTTPSWCPTSRWPAPPAWTSWR